MNESLPTLQSYTDEQDRLGGTQAFYRKVRCNALSRVHWGSYIDSGERLSRKREHELRVQALSRRGLKEFKLVGASAASHWGIWLQRDPVIVELTRRDSGQKSRKGYVRRSTHLSNPRFVGRADGIAVLGMVDTVVSLAVDLSRRWAVVAMDCLLRKLVISGKFTPETAKERVQESITKLTSRAKRQRVVKILDFSTWQSMSPGESLSRVEIFDAGLEMPELQVRFDDEQGFVGITDMYFRNANVVGEFDGRVKYTRAEYLNGRKIEDVVMAEKDRENRLRRIVGTVVRWTWEDLQQPGRLAMLLRQAGVGQRSAA